MSALYPCVGLFITPFAMEACYSTSYGYVGLVLMSSWFFCLCWLSSEDRAFEPVEGSYFVWPFWSWVRPTMTVVPSVTHSLSFSCLRRTIIISNPIQP